MQLRRYGYNPARINHIFISHLHGDHVFGLFGLLSSMGMLGRKKDLHLYGPEALRDLLRHHLQYFGPLPYALKVHSPGNTADDLIYEDKHLEVRRIPLKHSTVSFGYVFREKAGLLNIRKEQIQRYGIGLEDILAIKGGNDYLDSSGRVVPNSELTHPPYRARSYAYLSDTVYDPGLVPFVEGIDLLFHESTFESRDEALAKKTMHSTAKQAASIARDAGVGRLLLGHFSGRYKNLDQMEAEAKEVFPNTTLVRDGDCYSLPRERRTIK